MKRKADIGSAFKPASSFLGFFLRLFLQLCNHHSNLVALTAKLNLQQVCRGNVPQRVWQSELLLPEAGTAPAQTSLGSQPRAKAVTSEAGGCRQVPAEDEEPPATGYQRGPLATGGQQ